MPHLEALPLEPGIVPDLLTLDLCSTRSKLLVNQELKLRPLLPCNGETLKSGKNSHFAQSAPFCQIWSHISSEYIRSYVLLSLTSANSTCVLLAYVILYQCQHYILYTYACISHVLFSCQWGVPCIVA